MTDALTLQARIYQVMHAADPDRLNAFQRTLALLIVASVIVAILFSEPVVRDAVGAELLALEHLFGGLFLLEYLARIWSCGACPPYTGFVGRLRYMRQPIAVIDLLAVLPFLIGAFGAETLVLRLVRLLRLLALAKLARYSIAARLVLESLAARRFELGFALMLAVLVIVVSSAALYVIEGENYPEAFGSIPRAAWWSIATLTTVGYGDIIPQTPLGKVFAATTAIAGIGLIALPTGILAAAFSEAFAKARSASKTDTGKRDAP